jgi:hypothetical protein
MDPPNLVSWRQLYAATANLSMHSVYADSLRCLWLQELLCLAGSCVQVDLKNCGMGSRQFRLVLDNGCVRGGGKPMLVDVSGR